MAIASSEMAKLLFLALAWFVRKTFGKMVFPDL
jgi:hypothetical protein